MVIAGGGGGPKPPPETERVPQPPEGRLIESARRAIRPRLCVRDAARLAGVSPTGWLHTVNGWRWEYYKGRKQQALVTGKASTVAAMARVVGLTPADFTKIRPDVAAEMQYQTVVETVAASDFDPRHVALQLDRLRTFYGEAVFNAALSVMPPPVQPNKPKTIPLRG